jgi:hypothetical protein
MLQNTMFFSSCFGASHQEDIASYLTSVTEEKNWGAVRMLQVSKGMMGGERTKAGI